MTFLSVGEFGGMGTIILRDNRRINTGNVRHAAIKQHSAMSQTNGQRKGNPVRGKQFQ